MAATTQAWTRRALVVTFADNAKFTESYGFSGTSGMVNLEGQLLLPEGRPSPTLFLFMHPATTLQLLPMPAALASRGMHVLCAASRYPKNNSSLIMEKVALDMGAWIRHAREELGYERVVLVGWSGGGSLSLFYQSQAESPTVTATPAGDEVDLVSAKLPLADGIIFIAAHLSRAETLTGWLDPSVVDELDPDRRNRDLDIYAEDAPAKPPYEADFVARFREAQIARSGRITAWCQDMLEDLKRRGGLEVERAFVVHRTMCDVRWLDPMIDRNGRKPGTCYLGDPRTANVIPAGLARYSSLRSWLSQWSYDLSNTRSDRCAPNVRRTPVLQVENLADDAVPATHNPTIHRLLGTPDKEHVRIEGATHYYRGQPAELERCLAAVGDWCGRHGFRI